MCEATVLPARRWRRVRQRRAQEKERARRTASSHTRTSLVAPQGSSQSPAAAIRAHSRDRLESAADRPAGLVLVLVLDLNLERASVHRDRGSPVRLAIARTIRGSTGASRAGGVHLAVNIPMPNALTDPRCLVTPESLLIDGANGVCRDARLGSRDHGALRFLGLMLGALLVVVWLRSRWTSPRARVALVLVLAIGGATPGAYAILNERADRPTVALSTASTSMRLHEVVRSFARARGCARTTLDRCASCAPLVRLALAGLHCERPASIELHAGAFAGACKVRERTLVCGAR